MSFDEPSVPAIQPVQDKYSQLLNVLSSYERVAVAFSGGVDSALVVYAAHEALGENAIAMTADTGFSSEEDLADSVSFCERYGIEHLVVPTHQLENPDFDPDSDDRCYVCKQEMMRTFLDIAHGRDIEVLVDGSNIDDQPSRRPGMRALKELGVKSPLRSVGFTKADVRSLSNSLGLPTANKKSFSCLAVLGKVYPKRPR